MNNRKQIFSVYRLSVLALMIAVVQTCRLLFGFIPNVQPVTVILILMTLTFGMVDALIVGAGSILLSNFSLGMGPWTIAQITTFSIIILLTVLFSFSIRKIQHTYLLWLIFTGVTGLLYGLFISIIQAPFYGMNVSTLIGYWTAGLWFDVYHAVGNVGFFILLHPTLVPLFKKINLKVKKKNQ